jgi:hypothetical protein
VTWGLIYVYEVPAEGKLATRVLSHEDECQSRDVKHEQTLGLDILIFLPSFQPQPKRYPKIPVYLKES